MIKSRTRSRLVVSISSCTFFFLGNWEPYKVIARSSEFEINFFGLLLHRTILRSTLPRSVVSLRLLMHQTPLLFSSFLSPIKIILQASFSPWKKSRKPLLAPLPDRIRTRDILPGGDTVQSAPLATELSALARLHQLNIMLLNVIQNFFFFFIAGNQGRFGTFNQFCVAHELQSNNRVISAYKADIPLL